MEKMYNHEALLSLERLCRSNQLLLLSISDHPKRSLDIRPILQRLSAQQFIVN